MIHTPEFEPWNEHMVFELIDYDSKIRSRIQEIPSGWMVHVQTELWLMWRLRFEIAQAQPDTLPSQVFVRMIWKLMFGGISEISWELFRDWALRSGQNNKKQNRVLKIVAFEAGCAQLEITCLVEFWRSWKQGTTTYTVLPQRKDLQEFILPSSPKHHISAGLSPKEQQLSYREQVLQDSHTLEHYGIKRVGAPSLE